MAARRPKVSRHDEHLARGAKGSLQEAIDYPALYNRRRAAGLILGVIPEHVREHLGVEDAAGAETKAPKYSCR